MYLCSKEGLTVGGMVLRVVYPLPLMLKEIFSKYKKVVTVEVAYGDELKPAPLALLLRAHTLVDVKSMLSQATGRPVRPKMILKSVKAVLSK